MIIFFVLTPEKGYAVFKIDMCWNSVNQNFIFKLIPDPAATLHLGV